MKSKIVGFALLAVFLFPVAFQANAEGISVDAGLTPAQDRIIVRLQYRNIIRTMNGSDMVMHMMPVVVVYGLSPDVTLMMRNGYRAIGTNETTYKKMIQNFIWATGYNVVAIPLAAGVLISAGIIISPAVGAILMSTDFHVSIKP